MIIFHVYINLNLLHILYGIRCNTSTQIKKAPVLTYNTKHLFKTVSFYFPMNINYNCI